MTLTFKVIEGLEYNRDLIVRNSKHFQGLSLSFENAVSNILIKYRIDYDYLKLTWIEPEPRDVFDVRLDLEIFYDGDLRGLEADFKDGLYKGYLLGIFTIAEQTLRVDLVRQDIERRFKPPVMTSSSSGGDVIEVSKSTLTTVALMGFFFLLFAVPTIVFCVRTAIKRSKPNVVIRKGPPEAPPKITKQTSKTGSFFERMKTEEREMSQNILSYNTSSATDSIYTKIRTHNAVPKVSENVPPLLPKRVIFPSRSKLSRSYSEASSTTAGLRIKANFKTSSKLDEEDEIRITGFRHQHTMYDQKNQDQDSGHYTSSASSLYGFRIIPMAEELENLRKELKNVEIPPRLMSTPVTSRKPVMMTSSADHQAAFINQAFICDDEPL